MTGRQIGDERRRYGRKSLREQIEDLREPIVRFRFWIVAAVILLAVAGWLAFVSRNVPVDRLVVGDCLYIPTAAAGDPTSSKPIGLQPDVEQVLHAGGAQGAGCTSSHGHEVSALVPLGDRQPTQDAFRSLVEPRCTDAFADFVGHPADGSAFMTFAAVPTVEQWTAGDHTGVCLVARADGQWMTSPARGSGG